MPKPFNQFTEADWGNIITGCIGEPPYCMYPSIRRYIDRVINIAIWEWKCHPEALTDEKLLAADYWNNPQMGVYLDANYNITFRGLTTEEQNRIRTCVTAYLARNRFIP